MHKYCGRVVTVGSSVYNTLKQKQTFCLQIVIAFISSQKRIKNLFLFVVKNASSLLSKTVSNKRDFAC